MYEELSGRYTLLVGKPPFETNNLKDTYTRIRKNEYHIPSTRVSSAARALIQRMLAADPSKRPNMQEILADEFFTGSNIVFLENDYIFVRATKPNIMLVYYLQLVSCRAVYPQVVSQWLRVSTYCVHRKCAARRCSK